MSVPSAPFHLLTEVKKEKKIWLEQIVCLNLSKLEGTKNTERKSCFCLDFQSLTNSIH